MGLWHRLGVKDETYGIGPGRRFRSAGLALAVWEVASVQHYPGEKHTHVRLVRVGSPLDGKTVSLHVLRDRHYFEPLP